MLLFSGGDILQEVYFLPSGDHWVCKGGKLNMISNDKKVLPQNLGVDSSTAIASASAKLVSLKSNIGELDSQAKKTAADMNAAKSSWQNANKESKETAKTISEKQRSLEDLLALIEEEAEDVDEVDVTSHLAQEVQDEAERLEEFKKDLANLDVQIENEQPLVEAAQSKVDEVKARNDKILKELEAAEADLSESEKGKSQLEVKVEKTKKKLDEHRAQLKESEKNFAAKQADIDGAKRKATIFK